MGDTGLEHPPLAPSKTPISVLGGAQPDARNARASTPDAELAEIVAIWPRMSKYIKGAIKALTGPYSNG